MHPRSGTAQSRSREEGDPQGSPALRGALSCPACGQALPTRPPDHPPTLNACPTCGLGYTDPLPRAPLPASEAAPPPLPPSRRTRALVKGALLRLLGLAAGYYLRACWPPVPAARALDVGCGDGYYVRALAALGWHSVGLERSPRRARNAQHIAGQAILLADAHMPPTAPGAFHLITLWHVLEHLPDAHRALVVLRACLAPGGSLLVEVPNRASVQARALGHRWLHLAPDAHVWHFTPQTLRRTLSRAGFIVLRVGTFPNAPGWTDSLHIARRWAPLFTLVDGLWAAVGQGGVIRAWCRR